MGVGESAAEGGSGQVLMGTPATRKLIENLNADSGIKQQTPHLLPPVNVGGSGNHVMHH